MNLEVLDDKLTLAEPTIKKLYLKIKNKENNPHLLDLVK